MEQPSNSTEECQHINVEAFESFHTNYDTDEEYFTTSVVCLDCGKRVY